MTISWKVLLTLVLATTFLIASPPPLAGRNSPIHTQDSDVQKPLSRGLVTPGESMEVSGVPALEPQEPDDPVREANPRQLGDFEPAGVEGEARKQDPLVQGAPGGRPLTQGQGVEGPFESKPVTPGVSEEVRRLPVAPPWKPGDPVREVNPRRLGNFEPAGVEGEARRQDSLVQGAPGGRPLTQGQGFEGPFVSEPVTPGVSKEVRRLPVAPPWKPGDPVREINPRQLGNFEPAGVEGEARKQDPLLQDDTGASSVRTPAATLSFDGISAAGSVPPDPVGDVGPNHYVQMVNARFSIFNKSGTLLTGPTSINSLWTGEGNQCESNNNGDPIVLYDRAADRWLLSQFALPNGISTPPWYMCIAISQTPDPSGAYFLYQFQVPAGPDYPKFGVWPDAYYMATNEVNPRVGVFAFDRTNMLAGNTATFIRFTGGGNLLLPSDLDGTTAPPSGSPNFFYRMMDDTFWGGGVDRLEIFEFHAEFGGNSTFASTNTLSTAAFNYTVCGFFDLSCIPQPSPGELLDAISEWPMWRFQYRNFGTHETLVGNFTVDVDGTDHAGIRWFELRRSGGGSWTLFQEGTHAPDGDHRWIGSIATDQDGNIALAYSVSGTGLFPSIRYATRLTTDTAGTLQAEVTLIAGGGVQTAGFNRWGDYSSINVDPADDCTFWYTNEYYAATSSAGWRTRIGSFKIPSCGVVAENCTPPGSGNWVVSQSCTFQGSATAQANVIVEAGVTLTIDVNAALDINFSSFHLLVKDTAKVIIKSGGKIF